MSIKTTATQTSDLPRFFFEIPSFAAACVSARSLGKKATGWVLSADEVERQTKHQTMALSLLESLGVSVRVDSFLEDDLG